MNMQLLGIILLVLGVLFLFSGKVPFVGQLPGDLMFEHKNLKVYLPLGMCAKLRSKEARVWGSKRA